MGIHKQLIGENIQMVRIIQKLSQSQLAEILEVSLPTVSRWEEDKMVMSLENQEKFYSYAYKSGIELNEIKAQLYQEEYVNENQLVLFHGSKSEISGKIDSNRSKRNNDFGKGFYCGETLEQSSLFVSEFLNANVYILKFNTMNLKALTFRVDLDWMLTIAYFRGKLESYRDAQRIKKMIHQVETADYIIAPIADNRMFKMIDRFVEGEITDEQCKHFLSATNLRFQYVFKTQRAIENIELLERCYLCKDEKDSYVGKREQKFKLNEDKIKVVQKKYRGVGQYIDEIFI